MYLENENQKLRNLIAKKLNIPFEKAVCGGYQNENGTITFLNRIEQCDIYKCIENRGINLCYNCSEFPCDYLHPYTDKAPRRTHNTKVFNLCLIKKMGLEAWVKEKAKNVRKTYFKGKLRP